MGDRTDTRSIIASIEIAMTLVPIMAATTTGSKTEAAFLLIFSRLQNWLQQSLR